MQFKSGANSVIINKGIQPHSRKPNITAIGTYPLIAGRDFNQYEFNHSNPTYKTDDVFNIRDSFTIAVRNVVYNSNRRKMICTILPKNINFLSSVCVIDIAVKNEDLLYLVALLNSFTIDFLTSVHCLLHVNVHNIKTTPIAYNKKYYNEIVELCAKLICVHDEYKELYNIKGVVDDAERQKIKNQLDALVAKAYDITYEELEYILSTFPIVEQEIKDDILRRFNEV